MRKNKTVLIGTTGDRVNRFMRMCLRWQYDKLHGIKLPAAYYFTKFHVGKVSQKYFDTLTTIEIDRDWVIQTMNQLSMDRAIADGRLGIEAHGKVIRELEIDFDNAESNVKSDEVIDNRKVDTDTLMRELERRQQSTAKPSAKAKKA